MTPKRQKKLIERRIEKAYGATCSNIGVPIMKIGDVFAEGHRLVASGADDATLGAGLRAFVETIRA